MLAAGPAWHPLPFPSSPCLGQLPAPPSLPLPPLPPTPTFQWNCKEDRNKGRDLFFTLLLLRSNDITSAASSPRIPDARRMFPTRRQPSILFEFFHFRPISTKAFGERTLLESVFSCPGNATADVISSKQASSGLETVRGGSS